MKRLICLILLCFAQSGYSYLMLDNSNFSNGLDGWPELWNYKIIEYVEKDLGNDIIDNYLEITPVVRNGEGYAVLLNQNISAASSEPMQFYAEVGFSSECSEITIDAKITSMSGILTRKKMVLRDSGYWHPVESSIPGYALDGGRPVLQFDFKTKGCNSKIHVNMVQVGNDINEMRSTGRGYRERVGN